MRAEVYKVKVYHRLNAGHSLTMPTQEDSPPQESASPTAVVDVDEDEDENIPHHTLELYRHTMLRGANVGSLIGLLIGPTVLLYRGVRRPYEIMSRLGSASLKGVGIGMGLVALMTFAKTYDQTEEQMFDRAYRLRKNQGQVRLDKFTYGGAVLGGAVGAFGMPGAMVTGALQGASMGVGLAVFAHVLTKPKKEDN